VIVRHERIKAGTDEIRFVESDEAVASAVAAALPEVRRWGEKITGCAGPRSIRVVIADDPPRARDLYWFDPLAWLWLAVPLVAILAGRALNATGVAITMLLAASLWWALAFRNGVRCLKAWWPHAGGMTMMQYAFFRPVVALHWPRPPRSPAAAALAIPVADSEHPRQVVAHEYAHCLLRQLRGYAPAWLDEGFAFWFAEQATGQPFFRPESRACVVEAEPERDMRRATTFPGEVYYRLTARYYWEVRALAEEGLISEALRTPYRGLERFRRRPTTG